MSDPTRAFQVAQLAAMLAAKVAHPGQNDLNIHAAKLELEWALDRAEFLLCAAENRERIIHAYELFFDAPEFLPIEAIAHRFKVAEWRGLTSWGRVSALLTDIVATLGEEGPPKDRPPILAPLPYSDATPSALWTPPFVIGEGPKKKYRAHRIFLLAHIFFRHQFGDRIEISRSTLGKKNVPPSKK